jgi:Fe-S cluster biogenesis protein NfuA
MSETGTGPSAITIRAETSLADRDSCKFTVSKTVHPGGPFFFDSQEQAAGSPLIERLFKLPGVARVLISSNVVTIGKQKSAAWDDLKSKIGQIIRAQLLTGVRAILEATQVSSSGQRGDDEIRQAVQELLDRETNPSIAAHGGKISIADVKNGNLYITMSGGCQGCAASQVTLRQGFELMVRRVAPEVVDIIDATDHASGRRPFYARTPATHY